MRWGCLLTVVLSMSCSCGAGPQTAPPADPPGAAGAEKAVPAAASVPCAGAYPQGFRFMVGTVKHGMPPIAEPPAHAPFLDPTFNTCIVRVTDRKKDLVNEKADGLKNEYSRVNSFNADGSRILVRSTNAAWYLYDAHTFKRLERLPIDGAVDPRWDGRNPDLLFYTPDTRLVEYDIRRHRSRTLRDFARDVRSWSPEMVFGRWEGSPSADGNTFAFMVRDHQRARGLIVYDRRENPRDTDGKPGEILGRYDLDVHKSVRGDDPDSVSISPLGRYVWAQFDYCDRGNPRGTFERPCGAMVYDRTLRSGKGVVRDIGHADLAVDGEGREVAIYQDNDKDQVAVVDLETGVSRSLHVIDFSQGSIGFHFSGRAIARPGWAVVSAYATTPQTKTWLEHLVYLIELRPGGAIVPIAHHHSLRGDKGDRDYFAEPHASTNADLTRVLFTSNWGRVGTNTVDMYMITLPPDWPSRLE